MGSGASLPAPEELCKQLPEAQELSREEYVKEHHKFWEAYSNKNWSDAYPHVTSQTSEGALAALGEQNFENCLRISVAAISQTQESPKDVDQTVAVMCRVAQVAQWSPAKVAGFAGQHKKKQEVLEAFLKAAAPDFASASAEAQADQLTEAIDDKAQSYGFLVLQVVRACLAAGNLEEKALTLLEKYIKLHRPSDLYDGGDLLALWYALQWRRSGKKPKVVGKAAIVLFKSHHMKVIVSDDGEKIDGGVSSWDEEVLRNETVPEIMRDWRLFSDAMCFLTDGAFGIEPMVVDACWEVVPKAFNPMWDSKYTRCLSHSNFHSDKEFTETLRKWEEGYKESNGGESDVILFHLLFPAARPAEAKVDITVGGVSCCPLGHRAYKGRPAYQDEGLIWTHHHRVFWMFHESHHIYEAAFKDQLDFAELIKKTDHPMFVPENWMEEFKGGNDFFPGEHWQGKSEFDWYVQSITKRLNTLTKPAFGDYWTSWWGGKEEDEAGAYYDFVSEHHALWDAGVKADWAKVCELADSQLRALCHKKLGEPNYRNVVNLALRALIETGKPLEGPVLDALQQGMDVLEYPKERAEELCWNIPGEKKEELLKLFQGSDKPAERPRQKLQKKKSTAISIVDDHHQMWDAYCEKDWQEVLEHVETQVSTAARERLGDHNYRNCFHMSFAGIGNGKASPKDVDDALELVKKGMELTGWPLSTFADLLGGHPKKFEVLKPLDQEGVHHDYISEHHALWDAGVKEDWEKVCSVLDSQLTPASLKQLSEPNYRNVVIIGLRGLVGSGQAIDGPVVDALRKGMEVLGYPKDRAPELVNGIAEDKTAEILRIYGES